MVSNFEKWFCQTFLVNSIWCLGKPFLNAGVYVGYFKDVKSIIDYILEVYKMNEDEDDQKYFHYVYLNETLRTRHKIKLDHYSQLVFNIYGAIDEPECLCQNGTLKYKSLDSWFSCTYNPFLS